MPFGMLQATTHYRLPKQNLRSGHTEAFVRWHSSVANLSAYVCRSPPPLSCVAPSSATWVTVKATSATPAVLLSSLSIWFVNLLGQMAAPVWPAGSATDPFLKIFAWSRAVSAGAIFGDALCAQGNLQAAAVGPSPAPAQTVLGPREFVELHCAGRVLVLETLYPGHNRHTSRWCGVCTCWYTREECRPHICSSGWSDESSC